ncbi:hypothetical protein AB0J68_02995 [Micromonospora sp. NPDC049580]|uniref:hypothetical protein n=1 Tax=Micromonospora sp. NPDC049580 TaxID=3154832 RepID=UPI003424247E
MTQDGRKRDSEEPLVPLYRFNSPNEPVSLHRGSFSGLAPECRDGVIQLSCAPSPRLKWSFETHDEDSPDWPGEIDFTIERHGRPWKLKGMCRTHGEGWIDHCEFGDPDAHLDRLLVHWMNLADILGNATLEARRDGRVHWWAGRWRGEVEGWSITLDSRPDLSEIVRDAHADNVFVLTHVMEVRRSDHAPFSVQTAKAFLEQMRVGLSFALGRWVAPALPVGYGPDGTVIWESWSSALCDPLQNIGAAWLYYQSAEDFDNYVHSLLRAFRQDGGQGLLRFQMVSAVQTNSVGFVEQRITTAFSALENIEWVELVLSGRVNEAVYGKRWHGEARLREVLRLASMPTNFSEFDLPALEQFAKEEELTDAPAALVRFRNRLVHPKSPRDEIYHIAGVSKDAWFLARHYLTMLILHRIGYNGNYSKQMPPFGWFGSTEQVPWGNRA